MLPCVLRAKRTPDYACFRDGQQSQSQRVHTHFATAPRTQSYSLLLHQLRRLCGRSIAALLRAFPSSLSLSLQKSKQNLSRLLRVRSHHQCSPVRLPIVCVPFGLNTPKQIIKRHGDRTWRNGERARGAKDANFAMPRL